MIETFQESDLVIYNPNGTRALLNMREELRGREGHLAIVLSTLPRVECCVISFEPSVTALVKFNLLEKVDYKKPLTESWFEDER